LKEYNVIIRLFGILLVVITWNCAGNKYKQMASSNPNKLLSIKDSLLKSSSKTYIVHSIALAHKALGDSAITEGNYEKAKDHFTKALKLSPNDSLYMYSQLMVEGHLLQKSGKKDKLWSSIQTYNKAAAIFERAGDPYYYIGNSYLKLSDKDFDLIIESYEKALALELSTDLREQVIQARDHVSMREKKLKNFWK
tara:strand:+ start:2049 stop:2633 length:585 start_codon:yes stop_codon:yes gene_type:complete